MAKLTFIIEGDKAISRNFLVLAKDITKMRPEFKAVGQLVISGAKKNFDKQGSSISKWRPLAQSTLQARKRKWGYYKQGSVGRINQALVWTGRTRDSFVATTGDLLSVITNTSKFYPFHQSKARTSKKLPRRVMLDMSQEVKLGVTNIIAKGINKRVGTFNNPK